MNERVIWDTDVPDDNTLTRAITRMDNVVLAFMTALTTQPREWNESP